MDLATTVIKIRAHQLIHKCMSITEGIFAVSSKRCEIKWLGDRHFKEIDGLFTFSKLYKTNTTSCGTIFLKILCYVIPTIYHILNLKVSVVCTHFV